jgi:hypothetical protein
MMMHAFFFFSSRCCCVTAPRTQKRAEQIPILNASRYGTSGILFSSGTGSLCAVLCCCETESKSNTPHTTTLKPLILPDIYISIAYSIYCVVSESFFFMYVENPTKGTSISSSNSNDDSALMDQGVTEATAALKGMLGIGSGGGGGSGTTSSQQPKTTTTPETPEPVEQPKKKKKNKKKKNNGEQAAATAAVAPNNTNNNAVPKDKPPQGNKGRKKGGKKNKKDDEFHAWSAFQSSPDASKLPMPSFAPLPTEQQQPEVDVASPNTPLKQETKPSAGGTDQVQVEQVISVKTEQEEEKKAGGESSGQPSLEKKPSAEPPTPASATGVNLAALASTPPQPATVTPSPSVLSPSLLPQQLYTQQPVPPFGGPPPSQAPPPPHQFIQHPYPPHHGNISNPYGTPPGYMTIHITVPPGISGHPMVVTAPSGYPVQVQIPAGIPPGSVIPVHVPAPLHMMPPQPQYHLAANSGGYMPPPGPTPPHI